MPHHQLDAAEEDVVVDRRAVAEDEEKNVKARRYSEVRKANPHDGTGRSLTLGAFCCQAAGMLAHVGDMSWSRVNKAPRDVLSVEHRST